jgi:hypothetical protein
MVSNRKGDHVTFVHGNSVKGNGRAYDNKCISRKILNLPISMLNNIVAFFSRYACIKLNTRQYFDEICGIIGSQISAIISERYKCYIEKICTIDWNLQIFDWNMLHCYYSSIDRFNNN